MSELVTLLICQKPHNENVFHLAMPDVEFDMLILNHQDSVRKVEGLRVGKVYFTNDVFLHGINEDLFNVLYNNAIRLNKMPLHEVFQLAP